MALLPRGYVNAVTALGREVAGKKTWIGTGFFYGHFIGPGAEKDTHDYRTYLITNRHVKESLAGVDTFVRVNPKSDAPAKDYRLPASAVWFLHPDPDVDVAVVPVAAAKLKDEGMEYGFFRSDFDVATRTRMSDLEVTEGDSVYVLGFPMALVSDYKNTVVVRHGSIARVTDTLQGHRKTFLIDSGVYPGNSGGPVVLRPEATALQGTKAHPQAVLIGVVRSFLPYTDVAISAQTKRPRVTFEENSGLAEVHPVEYVDETVALHLATLAGQPQEAVAVKTDATTPDQVP